MKAPRPTVLEALLQVQKSLVGCCLSCGCLLLMTPFLIMLGLWALQWLGLRA